MPGMAGLCLRMSGCLAVSCCLLDVVCSCRVLCKRSLCCDNVIEGLVSLQFLHAGGLQDPGPATPRPPWPAMSRLKVSS